MSGEVQANSGRRFQMTALLGIAAAVLLFSGLLLTIMTTWEIQLATTIVAVGFLAFIAMVLYWT